MGVIYGDTNGEIAIAAVFPRQIKAEEIRTLFNANNRDWANIKDHLSFKVSVPVANIDIDHYKISE